MITGVADLFRIRTAGFEALVFILGPLLGGWNGSLRGLAILWLLGTLNNSFIFTLNDLVDLPFDRANPARRHSPLVNGSISVHVALGLSAALPITALMIVVALRWPLVSELSFGSMLILSAAVNLYQKATKHPILMEMLYAAVMAAPLPICARALLGHVTAVVWSASAALFLLSTQLNCAGNLKDLEADRRVGFRTVALSLGAAIAPDGNLIAGRKYLRYCWLLQIATSIALAVLTVMAVNDRPTAIIAVLSCLAVIATSWGLRDLYRLLAGVRPPSLQGIDGYFAAGFTILLAAAAVRSHLQVLMITVFALPMWHIGFTNPIWRNLRDRQTRSS